MFDFIENLKGTRVKSRSTFLRIQLVESMENLRYIGDPFVNNDHILCIEYTDASYPSWDPFY